MEISSAREPLHTDSLYSVFVVVTQALLSCLSAQAHMPCHGHALSILSSCEATKVDHRSRWKHKTRCWACNFLLLTKQLKNISKTRQIFMFENAKNHSFIKQCFSKVSRWKAACWHKTITSHQFAAKNNITCRSCTLHANSKGCNNRQLIGNAVSKSYFTILRYFLTVLFMFVLLRISTIPA